MAITTRAGKGSALTHAELDANFTELGLSHDDTDINLSVDEVVVTGNVTDKTTTIGDNTSATFAQHGFVVEAGDTAWAQLELRENEGTASKPVAQGFTNPGISTLISGGTTASPAGLGSGKRIMGIIGSATLDSSGTTPFHAQTNIKFETTEAQTSTSCGAAILIETSPNGRASDSSGIRSTTLHCQGDTIHVNKNDDTNDGKITSSGNLILDDDVIVEDTLNVKGTADFDSNVNMDGNLVVDGNVTLGDATDDTINVNGKLKANGGFVNIVLDTATANTLAGAGAIDTGGSAYISDGNAGSPCLAFYDGSNWKKAHDPANNISAT